MKVSNCCGAVFYEPGWPDNDMCSACKEHADVVEEEYDDLDDLYVCPYTEMADAEKLEDIIKDIRSDIRRTNIDSKVEEYLRIKTSYGKGRLTDEEINRLGILGKSIKKSLSCDINGEGLPCRTDRLAAVGLMKKYISIHNERL